MTPAERLDSILWGETLYGFPPFGADEDQPMVCFSESPLDHLQWLLATRGWPAWGLFFTRQDVYGLGGGPVWYTRTPQWHGLGRDQRRWAVRFDATPGYESDWLFEREWRVPVNADEQFLQLSAANVTGVLIGDPGWEPSRRPVPTGALIDYSDGQYTDPSNPFAEPELMPGLPPLWNAMDLRVYWNQATETLEYATVRT